MGTISQKLEYLNTTKEKIKDSINNLGGELTTNSTFRSYVSELDSIYSRLPKVSGTGSEISLSPTLKGRLGSVINGDTFQNGEPTPDTPIEIQSVEGIQNVEISGKNLLKNYASSTTTNHITFTVDENGGITADGTATGTAFILVQTQQQSPIFPAGDYTFSLKNYNSGATVRFEFYDVNGQRFTYDDVTTASKTRTINENGYLRVSYIYYSGDVVDNVYNMVQVEKGTRETGVVPYKDPQNYEINLEGKNLLNNTLLTEETYKYGITATPNSDGSITVNGLATANTYLNLMNYDFGNTNFNSANGGSSQYIASTGNSSTDVILYYNKNNKYSYIGILNGVRVDNITIYPMIRLSSISDSEYVPYRTPIKLYNGDYITGTPDNWSIVRNWKEVIFNGSESTWGSWNVGTVNRYYVRLSDNNVIINNGYCDYFILGDFADRSAIDNDLKFFVGIDNNLGLINFRYDSITTLANFKTWLSTHNTKVVYKLATPTTEAITDTNLISQLNALYNAKSCNGQTNISVSGNLPMILEVSALKDEI